MLTFAAVWACSPTPSETVPRTGATPTTAPTTLPPQADADGDGFSVADGDCNDGDPDSHPGAADTVGDFVDQNCDGIDGVDADGDGHASEASGGDDCNDDDPVFSPSAPEEYDCQWDGPGTPFFGSLTLTTTEAMTSFCQTYDVVAGDLTLSGSKIGPLDELSCLRHVEGILDMVDAGTVNAALPLLEEVGNILLLRGDALATVDLPALQTARNGLFLDLNGPTEEHEVSLPQLRTIHSGATFQSLHAVEIRLPALESVGGSLDMWVPDLTTFSAPQLETVGQLILRDCPVLESIDLPELREVDDLWVIGTTALADLSGIPALTVVNRDLLIAENTELSDISSLFGITDFGDTLYLCDNPKVPAEHVTTLVDLAVADGVGHIQLCKL